MQIIRKYQKLIAILACTAVLVTAFSFSSGGLWLKKPAAVSLNDEQENRIAAEISNMTGVKIEEIMSIRSKGKTWNEVLDKLKAMNNGQNDGEKEKRNNLLVKDSLGEDYVDKLKNEGFSDEVILEARLLVERVVFQLQQILSADGSEAGPPEVIHDALDKDKGKEEKDDLPAYRDIASKFDVKTAVYLTLKLSRDFGGMVEALDEYLLALQIGVNLELYLNDKEAYMKDKNEKSAEVDWMKLITAESIEARMLKKIQEDNEKIRNEALPQVDKNQAGKNNSDGQPPVKSPLPDVPMPDVKSSRPANPADEVMKEIKAINPL